MSSMPCAAVLRESSYGTATSVEYISEMRGGTAFTTGAAGVAAASRSLGGASSSVRGRIIIRSAIYQEERHPKD
jgi:hypothetical protein